MKYMSKRAAFPPAPTKPIWQNAAEIMSRYIYFLLAIMAGLGLGLLYGELISPVEFVDTTPDILREDYKTDYILMVAEAYSFDSDLTLAMRRLGVLGGATPLESVQKALIFAVDVQYTPPDLVLLRDLEVAVRAWDPSLESSQP